MEYIKQSMNDIWAAAGDVVMPEAVKIAEGWLVEVPPRQYWNWMQNRTDVNLAYIFQRGVPEWDISVEYLANKSFVVYNGVVYKCILTGVGKNPESQPTYWVRAFRDWSAIGQAVDDLTPAADRFVYYTGASTAALATVTSFARSILDDTSAAAVRTTIGAQASDATLTAVAGVTTAANKLIYFTGVDTAAATDLSAFGRSLIDDADASAARTTLGLASGATTTVGTMATQNANSVSITGGSITGITDLTIADGGTGASTAAGARSNLGLGTAAVVDVTASPFDITAGRVLKNGDWGIPTDINMWTTPHANAGTDTGTDLNTLTTAGWWRRLISPSSINKPSGGTGYWYLLVLKYVTGTNVTQVAFPYGTGTNGNIQYRSQYDGTWGVWRTLYDTSSFSLTASSVDGTAGRVTKVGDFGLGASGDGVRVSGDIDNPDLLLAGFYSVLPPTTLGTFPAGWGLFGGTLLVETFRVSSGTRFVKQTLTGNGSLGNKVYFRLYNGNTSTWSEWLELLHLGNQLNLGTTATSARTALGLGTAAVGTLTESTTDDIVGKVLKVGDFGIGSNAVTLTGVDLNTVVRTGFYIATSPVNGPAGVTTNLLVLGNTSGSGRTMQIAQPVNGEAYYVRSQSAGTWSTWKQFYHSGNLLNIGTTAATARTALELKAASTSATPSTLVERDSLGNVNVNGIVSTSNTTNGVSIRPYGSAGPDIRVFKDLAVLNNTTINSTGTIKITLPFSFTSTMLTLKIKGYDYSGTGYWEINASGYSFSTNSAWANTSADTGGTSTPFTSVRFGHDGSKCCILLGTTSSVVQYPKIVLSELMVSFANANLDWSTGWSITQITNETGITVSSSPVLNANVPWGAARTLTIGGTGKSVNGNGNVSWTLDEIGAVSRQSMDGFRVTSGGLDALISTGRSQTVAVSGDDLGLPGVPAGAGAGFCYHTAYEGGTGLAVQTYREIFDLGEWRRTYAISWSDWVRVDSHGEWVDVRPYLAAPFDWDTSRDGKNAFPQARVVNGKVEFRGVVRYNVTNSSTPAGVMFQNLPANLRPKYTLGGVGFTDTASPLWFGSYSWIAGGEVAYGGVPHGNVTVIMLNAPTPLTNAAFVLDQMSWFVN